MRQSHLFTKTQKSAPRDEVAKNAELLIRAGFVHKEMAGVYTILPLGLRVINKISTIIREELNAVGCQELQMTALQDAEVWKKTDRWDEKKVDAWFKTTLSNGTEVGLGLTHEEPLTNLIRNYISSYRDLPCYVYQIQTKFRNEKRAKSGMMRGREFLMKDLYSFNQNEKEREKFYEMIKEVYMKIFTRVGLGDKTFITFASGGIFSRFSHEFQTLCEAGEDLIYVDKEKKIAVNKEVYNDEVLQSLGLNKKNLIERKAIEVGNIFSLGTKFSEPLGLVFADESGKECPVIMGSYGIGVGRLMATVVEVYNDERGIVWPEAIAPYKVHLVSLCQTEVEIKQADSLYEKLVAAGVEVLYDDRQGPRAGEKFADSDLIGVPIRLVISPKTLANNNVEVKKRNEKEPTFVPVSKVVEEVTL